jgi:hypothetical protein
VGEQLTGDAVVAVEVEQRPLEPQRRDGDRAQHDEQAEQGRVTPPEQVVRGDQGSTAPAAGNATTAGAQRRMASISIGSEFYGSERGRPVIWMSVLTCNDAPG